MNTKRCQICWTGTACGEFMAIPMCLECLSHRFEIDPKTLEKWQHESVDESKVLKMMAYLPKLKPESEWQWWQGVARSRAYELLDESVREIERLRISEHDYREKFNWMFDRAMNTQRALLRLRIGFARLARDVFRDKELPKDAKFWDRVRHNFIFRLDRFNRRLSR